MAGDPITTGLIASAAFGATSTAQQLGTALSASKQQKRREEVAIAQDRKDIAQAEQKRQERLSHLLEQRRVSQAAAGITGGIAQTERLFSQANADHVADQNNAHQFRPNAGLGRLNGQILSSINQIGGVSRSLLHIGQGGV